MTAWMEKWRVGAVGEEFSLTVIEKFLVSTHALCFYAWKAVLPRQLTFIYPRWDFKTLHILNLAAPALCVLIVFVLVYFVRKGKRGPFAVGALYAGTLFPALGFFNVYPMRYSFVADHFSYLAMMPLLTGVAWLVFEFAPISMWTSLNSSAAVSKHSSWLGQTRGSLFLSCFLIAAVCIPLTIMQTAMYHDLEILWRTTIQRNPTAWMAHHNLGILLESKGEQPRAMIHYLEAIALNPRHVSAMNNAGLIRIQNNDFVGAERLLRRAVDADPEFAAAHNNLGITLVRQGRFGEAIRSFQQALEVNPGYANARTNLSAVQRAQGKDSQQ
jgi:tetratricopeptide (TPR) repeat protein